MSTINFADVSVLTESAAFRPSSLFATRVQQGYWELVFALRDQQNQELVVLPRAGRVPTSWLSHGFTTKDLHRLTMPPAAWE